MKVSAEVLEQHGTGGDSRSQSAYFSECKGPVFDFKCVFIPCYPYSTSTMLVAKPFFIPGDEMPPIVLRIGSQFGK
jgi:hypothetical protein